MVTRWVVCLAEKFLQTLMRACLTMPPKKNGEKTADKPTKKEDANLGEKAAASVVLPEGSKEFYLAQIRDLEERIEKYQHKCDELEVREKDFSAIYKNLEREKKDIVLYLKRCLAQKEDELTDLSEKLLALQTAKDAEKESFEMQLRTLRHEFQENKDKLTSENMALAGKLASLEEFRVQKDELMALLASQKEQLEEQEKQHQKVIYDLERKAVLDKDRLKKEMQQHVAAVAAEFRRVSDSRMPETTLRTMHENVSVTAQLRQLADRTTELLDENDALKSREQNVRRELEIMESLLNGMTRKSVGNQKVVQQLTEKGKEMQTELEKFARHKQEHQQLLDGHFALQKEHDDLRRKHESLTDELYREQAEAERRQEAAMALKEALTELLKEDTEVHVLIRRNQIMQKLLAALEGPALSDFIPKTDYARKLKTEEATERPGHLAPPQKATSRLPLFKTGDLGLVPRQTNMRSSVLSKIGPLSKSTQLHMQRNSQSQKRTDSSKPLPNDNTFSDVPAKSFV